LAQGEEESVVVLRIKKDVLPAVTAVHHVVDRAGVFQSGASRHGGRDDRMNEGKQPKNSIIKA
jgi:hypothetical protein